MKTSALFLLLLSFSFVCKAQLVNETAHEVSGLAFIAPNEFGLPKYAAVPKLLNAKTASLSVGTFRALNLIASAESDFGFLFDYDQRAVQFNEYLLQLIAQSEDPIDLFRVLTLSKAQVPTDAKNNLRSFLKLSVENIDWYVMASELGAEKKKLLALIEGPDVDFNQPVSNFKKYKDFILALSNYADNIPLWDSTFFATQKKFSNIKELISKKQIFVVRGNLAGTEALASIASFAHSHNIQFVAVDISNAFGYIAKDGISHQQFLTNISALPVHKDAKLLFTNAVSSYKIQGRTVIDWSYFSLPLLALQKQSLEQFKTVFYETIAEDFLAKDKAKSCRKIY